MDAYLMMLYVTLEQESAMKEFFLGKGWAYCKPDLRIGTDTLGPLAVKPTLAITTEVLDSDETVSALPAKRPRITPLRFILSKSPETTGKQPVKGKSRSKKTTPSEEPISVEIASLANPLTEQDFDMDAFIDSSDIKIEQASNSDDDNDNDQGNGEDYDDIDESDADDFVDESETSKDTTVGDTESVPGSSNQSLSAATCLDVQTPRSSGRKRKQTRKIIENKGEQRIDDEDNVTSETKSNRTVSPNPMTRKNKQYSCKSLTNAYLDVKDKKLSVSKAAKFYGVPDQTLRDRITGKINAENVTYGRGPLFSVEEEARLVRHIQEIAAVGYGYRRSEVVNLASEYAVLLHKRDKDGTLTQKWFYGLLARWPELKVYRPKTVSELRSKARSVESFHKYFQELGRILDKYQLKDKPQNIYNVDEKGIQQNIEPIDVVSSAAYVPSAVTSERSATTTILGCGNAIGYQVPPYFVFQDTHMRDELLEGCCTGAQGTVSKSGSSNSTVFFQYLQTHFIKYVKSGPDDHVLLLYDGHRSHISPFLVDWAAENNIIMFVLPPHTSHILQPMDVGCFGPFFEIYSDECQKHHRSTGGGINRYNVCSVACKAYTKGLAPENLQSAFRKCGVYPYNPSAIDTSVFIAEQTRKQ